MVLRVGKNGSKSISAYLSIPFYLSTYLVFLSMGSHAKSLLQHIARGQSLTRHPYHHVFLVLGKRTSDYMYAYICNFVYVCSMYMYIYIYINVYTYCIVLITMFIKTFMILHVCIFKCISVCACSQIVVSLQLLLVVSMGCPSRNSKVTGKNM